MLGYIVTLHCYVRLLRYRLWSAATLGVPGSKSRRLFSSRGRLSLLNISVAPGKCSFWQAPNLSNDVWYMVIIMQEDVFMCATWLFWKWADVTGKLSSRLWTSGAWPEKSISGLVENFTISTCPEKNGKFKYFPHQKLTAELEKVHPNISSSTRFM